MCLDPQRVLMLILCLVTARLPGKNATLSRHAVPAKEAGLCNASVPGDGAQIHAAKTAVDSAADRRPERTLSGAPGLPGSTSVNLLTPGRASAGRVGFLRTGSDGHFHWPDGSRARFWGINVSSTRLDIPDAQIEQTVSRFASAGLNLVRLEAIDNWNCLLGGLDATDSQHFDPRYLDRIDRWIEVLRRHGICYYLDLLDLRAFRPGDGVLNAARLDRGARPYALFDRYLIDLQKEYAARLLTHRNPYTGLRPVDDPALVMVEICNENGFFIAPERLETLVEPYRSDLRRRWNQWLRNRYGTRARLEAEWGALRGTPTLRSDEDPAAQTVDLPRLTRPPSASLPANVIDVRGAPTRARDGARFLAELQRAYFREMRAYLRTLGLKIPVTAVVSSEVVPDVASVAEECDFTAENWYGDGPTEDARRPGARFYSNRNPLREDGLRGFAPYTANLRWNNKPVVIREWAVPWPNRWRAASVPEALACAALQDFDAVLLFGYQTNRAPNGAEPDALNDFACQSDPTVWGLYGLAGRAFLTGAIRPAQNVLTLVYPDAHRYVWPNTIGDLHRAAWSVRVQSLSAGAPPARNVIVPDGGRRDLLCLGWLLDDLRKRGSACSADSLRSRIWRSDTGEVTRNPVTGRLVVNTPRLRMIAGTLESRAPIAAGGLEFSTPTGFGALLALSLDGRPLEQSRHYVVKMVSRSENTGENLRKNPRGISADWELVSSGRSPVQTFGRVSARPTRVWLGRRKPFARAPLLCVWMVDGVWEMEVRDGRVRLVCDTPGIAYAAAGRRSLTVAKR